MCCLFRQSATNLKFADMVQAQGLVEKPSQAACKTCDNMQHSVSGEKCPSRMCKHDTSQGFVKETKQGRMCDF